MSKSSHKLPYIPDKDLYAAVMFACKMIRENGYFNKGVKIAADYYNCDVKDVEKYVRIAQGNGQKQANSKKPPRKYYWFAVEYSMGSLEEGYFDNEYASCVVIKATNEDNAKYRLHKYDSIYGGPQHWIGRIKAFETESEATEQASKWQAEDDKYASEMKAALEAYRKAAETSRWVFY